MWQVDPAFKVQFFYFLSEVLLYGFHWGHQSFGPNFLTEFCKENESFDKLEWNKRFLYVSSVLIIDLMFLLLSLHLFMHLLYSENYINIEFFQQSFIYKKIILSPCYQYLWIRKPFLMAINIGCNSRLSLFNQVIYENA